METTPYIPNDLKFSSNGLMSTDRSSLRRGDLESALNSASQPTIEIGPTFNPDPLVIVPVHNDNRIPTLRHTFDSLAEQERLNSGFQVVVSDNGLTDEGVQEIHGIAEGLGLGLTIVNARPEKESQKNAAHARNQAFQTIASLAEQDSRFRTNGVLLIDSDTALLPHALTELQQTYYRNPEVSAVQAVSVSAHDIGKEARVQYMSRHDIATGREQRLPKVYRDGEIDIASIVAFGSDIATKTCGVFVDRVAMAKMGQKPFVQMPHGSAEDMVLAIGLGRHGDIYSNSRAQVLDLDRPNPSAIQAQRTNWGRDHAILFNDFVELKHIKPGIKIFEPINGQWVEWIIPGSEEWKIPGSEEEENVYGVIVNPEQLKSTSQLVIDAEKNGTLDTLTSRELRDVQIGISHLQTVISRIDSVRDTVQKTVRPELPTPVPPNPSSIRFSNESLTGLLVGNILGMCDEQELSEDALPKRMFYGVRQSASWSV
jgi:glycosyltransferase involved in cell wall biosynthesis